MRFKPWRRRPKLSAQIGNHPVERLDVFVGAVGCVDLYQFKQGLRPIIEKGRL